MSRSANVGFGGAGSGGFAVAGGLAPRVAAGVVPAAGAAVAGGAAVGADEPAGRAGGVCVVVVVVGAGGVGAGMANGTIAVSGESCTENGGTTRSSDRFSPLKGCPSYRNCT